MLRRFILALASVALLSGVPLPLGVAFAQSNWQQQQQWQRQQDMQRQQQEQQRQQQQAQQRQQMQDQQRQQMQAQQRQQMQEQQRQQMQAQQRQQMQQQQQAQRRQQMQQQQQTQQRQVQQQQQQAREQGTLQPGSNKSTGVIVSGGVAKMARPLTPAEIQRGFTGRVTQDGRALVKFQNRIFAVPASRISGLTARLRAKREQQEVSRWTAQQQNEVSATLRGKLLASTSQQAVTSRMDAAQVARLQARGFKDDSVGAMRNDDVSSDRKTSRQLDKGSGTSSAAALDAKWLNADGSIKWPPNGGFRSFSRDASLQKGQLIDRYGDTDESGKDHGNYFAPKDTPFEQRSLPDFYREKPKHTYRVLKELPATGGESAAWFGHPGGGMQYRINQNAAELERLGYIERVK